MALIGKNATIKFYGSFEAEFYMQSGKVYPQFIDGKYRNLKNLANIGLLLIYFLCSWIRWDRGEGNPDQALIIDLPNRLGYFFSIQIWHDEVYYVMGLLILGALGLFFFTSLYGRLWCGYTCPQTVFTDIFLKIERFWEGDRNARMRLDNTPMNKEKMIKKRNDSWVMAFAFFCFCIWLGLLFL